MMNQYWGRSSSAGIGAFVATLALSVPIIRLGCLAGASDAGGATFERLGPEGGEVRSLLMDSRNPRTVFLGTTDGQILRSADGGRSWELLHPGLGRRQMVIDTLVQDPANPARILAGGWDLRSNDGGLFESRNSGESWSEIALPERPAAVRGLAICRDRPAHMIVGTLAGAYLSHDGGASWQPAGGAVPPFQAVESVAIDPRDPRTLYVGTWRLAYRSTDSGKTWKRIDQGMVFDSDVFSLVVTSDDSGRVYAGACSGIYRSANRGASWRRLRLRPGRFTVRALLAFIDPTDPRRVYGGTTEGLYVSSDAGESWTRLTPDHLIINAIQVDPGDGRTVLIGTGAQGVLRSADGGRTWKESNRGFVHRQISRIVPDPEQAGALLAGVLGDGPAGGVFVFDSYTDRWTRASSGLDAGLEVLSFVGTQAPKAHLAGTRRGLFLRTGPRGSWSRIPGVISRRTVTALSYDAENSLVFAGTDEGIYRARAHSWDFYMPPASPFRPWVYCLALARARPALLYAGTSIGLLRSRDRGDSWEVLSRGLPERLRVQSIAVSRDDPSHLFLGTSLGLYESRSGGEYWEKARDARLAVDVPAVIFLDPAGKRVLVGDASFGGVYLSEDGGRSWARLGSPRFNSPVRDLAQDPANPSWVYVGTNSEGVYRVRMRDPAGGPSD